MRIEKKLGVSQFRLDIQTELRNSKLLDFKQKRAKKQSGSMGSFFMPFQIEKLSEKRPKK